VEALRGTEGIGGLFDESAVEAFAQHCEGEAEVGDECDGEAADDGEAEGGGDGEAPDLGLR